MTTISLTFLENAKQTDARLNITGESVTFAGRRPPVFVPKAQLYYWTREWQESEAAAINDVLEGRVRRFTTGAEAAAWLLAADPADED